MKLATRAYVATLILLMLVFTVTAQTVLKSEKDSRNTAPTVGTGGPIGGPTGLFTVYDQETLRKGEYTFSIAYSNFDRDPGNVDITEVPLSFNIGISNHLELFFNTDAWRGVKVNAPTMLSSFYLPNSQLKNGTLLFSPAAIVLAPQGPGTSLFPNAGVFRPQGNQPFAQFPFTGLSAGNFGLVFSGPTFGFTAGTNATLGAPRIGSAADLFPGVGSPYGSILPGIVLTTTPLTCTVAAIPCGTAPVSFTNVPTYLPDAPFINRTYGQTSFNTLNFGGKWRLNSTKSGWGHGLIAYYRWYMDKATDLSGFNMMQRGSGSGSNKGDIGVGYFIGARTTDWSNVSANITYVYTSKIKGNFGGTDFVMLDPGDQLQMSIGADFPINKFFQPILEWRWTKFVGGRTPNALEQDPMDVLGGVRIFPRRWFGVGVAYRLNVNQQDEGAWGDQSSSTAVVLTCVVNTACSPLTVPHTFTGVPPGVVTSSDPHGFIVQFWAGRRDKRGGDIVNQPASVDSVTLSDTTITLPCRPGYRSSSGACNDSKMVDVKTVAHDPENDVLTYNYTVSGGRIVGQGANVQWDLSTAQVGTYTITTGVDDGCGVCGKTDTRTITVQECPDCVQICSCPTLSVSGPSGITQPGESMTFTASASGGNATVTYNWTVSAGTITAGQGTSSITVATNKDMAGNSVTATVNIGGTDPTCNCTTSAEARGDVAANPQAQKVDEFGKLSNDDVKARVDNFYIQLNNNPGAQGYIINYGTPAEIRARRAQITKAITFRKYDASRVTFIDGPDKGTGVSTTFWVVPSGAVPPTPE